MKETLILGHIQDLGQILFLIQVLVIMITHDITTIIIQEIMMVIILKQKILTEIRIPIREIIHIIHRILTVNPGTLIQAELQIIMVLADHLQKFEVGNVAILDHQILEQLHSIDHARLNLAII